MRGTIVFWLELDILANSSVIPFGISCMTTLLKYFTSFHIELRNRSCRQPFGQIRDHLLCRHCNLTRRSHFASHGCSCTTNSVVNSLTEVKYQKHVDKHEITIFKSSFPKLLACLKKDPVFYWFYCHLRVSKFHVAMSKIYGTELTGTRHVVTAKTICLPG